ncbi:DUF6895 family protein [Streptomyces cremeus]|uniref:DUF6895 family protein n=1 Tax=Streptomyces cremeus TaxID=66881 RepID=A0ABV5PFD9_STRCM
MTPAPRTRPPGPLDAAGAADRVLSGALRWIETQVEWFAPERWEQYLPRRPFRAGPLLELLGLVRVLDRAGVLADTAPLRSAALDLAEEAVRARSFEAGLRAGDDLFPYHLNLIALLDRLGRPQPALRRLCQTLLTADAGGLTRPYKPVFNRLELRYFTDRGAFTPPPGLPEAHTLLQQSIAALHPDVLHLTESETYALTHVVFYATDFGRNPLMLDDAAANAHLRATVRTLLGVHLSRASLDLLAELLLCTSALAPAPKTPETPAAPSPSETPDAATAAWHALAAASRPDGAVPGPVHRPEVMAGLSGDKAAAYLFGTCYHTTTVAALAAATRKPHPSDASHPLTLPPAEPDRLRSWAHEVTSAAASAPRTLRASWAAQLDPLLVIAAQTRDPDLLATLLHTATALDLATLPVPHRAAALLSAWTH